MIKLLIIGSGGREHSLAITCKKSPRLEALYVAPGNAGTAAIGTNVSLSEMDFEGLANFVEKNNIDITFVGPEAPLVAGIVDYFESRGLTIIGPSQEAALLEGSKEWSKNLMKEAKIPTAEYAVFLNYNAANHYLISRNVYPIVIKADGLAAGKGVTVAGCYEEAKKAIHDCFINHKFKEAGSKVVIEDFLEGEEASIFAFTDGKTILPLVPAQDHKAIFDGDKGPNTGGMGAYSPAPIASELIQKKTLETVFKPLLKMMQKRGLRYTGVVYAGLMIKGDDLSIVEFNARFGDPETQVVLARLETDLLEVFEAIVEGTLEDVSLKWSSDTAVCVVMASGGYPGDYQKGVVINGLDQCDDYGFVVHAGTINAGGDILTNGGRVLGVVSQGGTIRQAIERVYDNVVKIDFDKAYYRKDIGFKAMT